MGRLKSGLIGAGIGVLPGALVVALVTLDEAVRGPAEWHLTVAAPAMLLAFIGLVVGAAVGSTRQGSG